MAQLRSTTNQGPRLGKASIKGKVSPNKMGKPALAARIKNSQGIGGGLQQSKGGAKYVSKAKPKGTSGLNQKYAFPGTKKVKGGPGKTNLRPIKAQPKSPKNNGIQPKNNFALHNNVGPGDVARLRKASSFPPVKLGGGGFRSYIGGK